LLADWRVQDFEEDFRDENFFDEDLRGETLRDTLRDTFLGALRADLRFGADI
jgi:hypothetical protein